MIDKFQPFTGPRHTIDAYWAKFLGRSPEREEDLTIVESETSPGIVGLEVNGRWIFSIQPALTAQLEKTHFIDKLIGCLDDETNTQEKIKALIKPLGDRELYGPALLLYCTPETFRPVDNSVDRPYRAVSVDDVILRPLDANDQLAIQDFEQGMGTIPWTLDDPEQWPRIYGIFHEEQLVSAGAIQLWEETIGEIFVDTLPAYRSRGYAKRLASHLTEWIFHNSTWLPQYDAEINNVASLWVAHALGYQYYGRMVWIT